MENLQNEKLSFKEKMGFFGTALASDMSGQFTSTFLLFFFNMVCGIDMLLASTVISLSVIWDAINDPIIANIVDNNPSKNGERLRPILLWSSIPFACCLLLLFLNPFPEGTAVGYKIAWCFGWYFIYMIPKTFYYLPVYTLRQVATPDNDERLKINAFISYGQAFGSALPTIAILPIIIAVGGSSTNSYKDMDNPKLGFFIGALICAVVVVAASIYNYLTTKERVKNENKKKISILKAMGIVIKDRNFLCNLGLFFFYGLVVTLTTGYAMYYCTFVLDSMGSATLVSAFFIIGTLIATPFVRKMYDKLGRTLTTVIGSGILAIGAVIFLLFARTMFGAFALTFFIGVGTAITIIVIGMNRADVTDVIEYKNKQRMDGMVNNVSSLIQKIAKSIITLIIGAVLTAANFNEKAKDAASQPEEAKLALILVMGLGVLISAILMIVFSLTINLDKEMAQIKTEKEGNK